MTVRIHYTLPDGSSGSILLRGSLEELQALAPAEVAMRNGSDPWSEVIEE